MRDCQSTLPGTQGVEHCESLNSQCRMSVQIKGLPGHREFSDTQCPVTETEAGN